jgi:hypothetical protein
MASTLICKVPVASQVEPLDRSVHVEAVQCTTSGGDEIPHSQPTPDRVLRGPPLSSTSTFRKMGMFCVVFCGIEMGLGGVVFAYTHDAGAFWSVVCGFIAGNIVAIFKCRQVLPCSRMSTF